MKFSKGEYVRIKKPPKEGLPSHWVAGMLDMAERIVKIDDSFDDGDARYIARDFVWKEDDFEPFPYQEGYEVSFTEETISREPAYLCMQDIHFGRITPDRRFEVIMIDFKAGKVVINYNDKYVAVDPHNLNPESVRPKRVDPNIAFRRSKQKIASPFKSFWDEDKTEKLQTFKKLYSGVIPPSNSKLRGVTTGRIEINRKPESSSSWKTYAEYREANPPSYEQEKMVNVKAQEYHVSFDEMDYYTEYKPEDNVEYVPKPKSYKMSVDLESGTEKRYRVATNDNGEFIAEEIKLGDVQWFKSTEETTLKDLEISPIEEPKKEENSP